MCRGACHHRRVTSNVLPAEDRIERYTRDLVAYVRSLFPMRFYAGEKWWTVYTAAALLRLTDMADAVLVHLPQCRDLDAAAALRSMYELAVTVAWVLIDPERRTELWQGEARAQELKLHNDLATFGERCSAPQRWQLPRRRSGFRPWPNVPPKWTSTGLRRSMVCTRRGTCSPSAACTTGSIGEEAGRSMVPSQACRRMSARRTPALSLHRRARRSPGWTTRS